METRLTIGEAARAAGLSIDAVRFYERSGIIEPVPRTNGRRSYGEREIAELTIAARYRATRMTLPEVKTYLALMRRGGETLEQRKAIIAAHRDKVAKQLAELQTMLTILDFKLAYARELESGEISLSSCGVIPSREVPNRTALELLPGGRDVVKRVARKA